MFVSLFAVTFVGAMLNCMFFMFRCFKSLYYNRRMSLRTKIVYLRKYKDEKKGEKQEHTGEIVAWLGMGA